MLKLLNDCARLDEQLEALERKLREADGQVQHLLGHSTAMWLDEGTKSSGQQQLSSCRGQGLDEPEDVDDADGPIQRRRQ